MHTPFTTSNSRVLKPTIIIIADPIEDQRGYSLKGREFFLKDADPVRTESIGLDGVSLTDWFFVVTAAEYFRVVPEAGLHNGFFEQSNVVLIPQFAVKRSFRPIYLAKA